MSGRDLSGAGDGGVCDPMMVDLDLFGCWEAALSYGVDLPCDDPLAEAVRAVVLETNWAEPVAALYEQRRVVHAGRFVELQDQMCDYGPEDCPPAGRPTGWMRRSGR
jgi:hypothetical protein